MYNAHDLHAARTRTSPAEHGQGLGAALDEHRDLCYTYWDYRGGSWQKNLGLRIDHILLHPLVCCGRARASVLMLMLLMLMMLFAFSSVCCPVCAHLLSLSRAVSHALGFHHR